MPESSQQPPSFIGLRVVASLSIGWLYSLAVALVLFGAWESGEYARILDWYGPGYTPAARVEAQAAVVFKTLALVSPSLLLGAGLYVSRRPRVALWVGTALFFLLLWLLLLDLSLYLSVGRHLKNLWAFRNVPHGAQAAGDSTVWLISGVKMAGVALVGAAGYYFAVERGQRALLSFLLRRPQAHRPLVVGGGAVSVLMAIVTVVPHARALHLDSGARERLYGAMPVDVRLLDAVDYSRDDSPLGRLGARLENEYRRRYSAIRTQNVPQTPEIAPGPRPPIVFLVLESWRKDALSHEQMPRLSAWGREHAHQFQAHEAGTYSSEAGMFALLYGRNNLSYHETLDAKVRPLLFTWLRSVGYEISYYSGHPIEWLRREEFLSADTVDHLVHNDDGTWPEWDTRALKKMTEVVTTANKPTFSLVFLMSSHFEYQYPPQYEKHLPVAQSKFQVTKVSAFDETDRIPHHNRYKNSMAFLDDIVTDAIEKLPKDALIVVVGDHGESFYEGGHYGHGFAFTDPVLEVPLLIRFPEGGGGEFDRRQTVTNKTLHRDVIGWLAAYLNGGTLFLDGFHGRQSWGEDRTAHLSTYSAPGRSLVYSMLSVSRPGQPEVRMRVTFRNKEPRLRVLGFEQKYGLPTEAPRLDAPTIRHLGDAFAQELDLISR